jgi:hypothetical protein
MGELETRLREQTAIANSASVRRYLHVSRLQEIKGETMNAKPVHAELGASNCERWWNCPGSVGLIAKAPPPKVSIHASTGTIAHKIAAEALTLKQDGASDEKVNMFLLNKIGTWDESDGNNVEIDQDMIDAIKVYINLVEEVLAKHELSREYLKVETQVKITGVEVEDGAANEDLYGTADAIIVVPFNRIIVIDYKNGAGHKVEVIGNKQLLYYALGAYLALEPYELDSISTIEIIVCQPRHYDGGIQYYEIELAELLAFHKELIEAAKRVKPDAPVNAGAWCKWCPAIPICPVQLQLQKNQADLDFANVPVLLETTTPALVPVSTILSIVENEGNIRKMLDAMAEHVAALLHNNLQGVSEEDAALIRSKFKLVDKRANRQWKDENEAAKTIEKILGENTYVKRKMRTPKQIEDDLKKLKALGVDAKIVDELAFKPDNGLTMAKTSDKREARTPIKEAKEFDDL